MPFRRPSSTRYGRFGEAWSPSAKPPGLPRSPRTYVTGSDARAIVGGRWRVTSISTRSGSLERKATRRACSRGSTTPSRRCTRTSAKRSFSEWRGVAPREIATQLGMSAPATHALLTRARRSLADALTVARRPVLGLAWLAIELRSHVKALLGGVSAKATATAVAVGVAMAGAGGLAVEKSLSEPKAAQVPVQAPDRQARGPLANAPAVRAPRPAVRVSGGTSENGRTSARETVRPIVAPENLSTVTTVSVFSADEPQPIPSSQGTTCCRSRRSSPSTCQLPRRNFPRPSFRRSCSRPSTCPHSRRSSSRRCRRSSFFRYRLCQ